MSGLFTFLFFITFALLIVSLVKPGLLNKLIKRELSRKQSGLSLAAILFVLLILIGITAPPQTKTPKTEVKGEAITQEVSPSPTIEPSSIPTPSPSPSPSPTVSITPSPKLSPISSSTNQDILSCKNGTYTNVDGNLVCRPEYSENIPAGATAICGDGTYSFSQHRQGTCSHHGGVARWL